MTGRIKVRELMQREGLKGEVVNLFPSWHTGIIHGDDGYDVTFSDDSLVVGFSYSELSLGLRVSYSVFFAAGAKVPTAINMQPVQRIKQKGRPELADEGDSATGRLSDGVLAACSGMCLHGWEFISSASGELLESSKEKSNDGRSDWHIYRRQEKGMIRGDDGHAIAFPQVRVERSGVSRPLLRSTCQLSDSRGLAWQGGCERPPAVSGSISSEMENSNGWGAFPGENSSG